MPALVMEQVLAFSFGSAKALAGMSEGEIQNMSRALSEFDSKCLTPPQASQIYHALTPQKTLVSSREKLQLVCLALDHILADTVDVPKSEKEKEDLCKAMDALAPNLVLCVRFVHFSSLLSKSDDFEPPMHYFDRQ